MVFKVYFLLEYFYLYCIIFLPTFLDIYLLIKVNGLIL